MTQGEHESTTRPAQASDEHGNGEEQPHVVVRDRRRIDPETGQVRSVQEEVPANGATQRGRHAAPEPDDQADGQSAAPAEAGADTTALDEVRRQLDERTADLQRLTAEYANYRKRVERDRQVVVDTAKAKLAGELLAVLDDIERADAHGDLTGAFKTVADKLVGSLQRAGLEPFGHEGEEFDPSVHEAVQHSTSPDVTGPTVTAVLRRGYRFGERLVRPALVAVTDHEPAADAAGTSAASEEQQQETGQATGEPAGEQPAGEQD